MFKRHSLCVEKRKKKKLNTKKFPVEFTIPLPEGNREPPEHIVKILLDDLNKKNTYLTH